MQVYLLRGADDDGALRPADAFDWVGRGGTPFVGVWPDPILAPYADQVWQGFDCAVLSAATDGIVLSARAVAAFGPLVGSAVLHPVLVLGVRYHWLNVLDEVDALSDATEGERVAGFLVSVRRLVFRQAEVMGAPQLFRVPELPAGFIFARDQAVAAAEGLSGFRFDLVWSLSGGGVLDAPGLGDLGG